jgi:hypothetical protein
MKLSTTLVCALALAACTDSNDKPFVDADGDGIDDTDPTALRNFTMTFENVAPFTVLKASVQTARPDKTEGSLAPGEAYEIRFTAGVGHYLSLAAMLRESNDWFFGTEPSGIPLYNNGTPLSGDITSYIRLWDAGTEYDEEPGVGGNTGLLQATTSAGAADPDNRVRLVGDVATLSNGAAFARPPIASMIRVTLTPSNNSDRSFLLRIENVSTTETLVTSAGNKPITVMNTLWAIHCSPNVLFDADMPARANGLEALAEAGNAWTLNDKLRLERGIATPLTPGVFVVHANGTPLFTVGQPDYRMGLERIAEDGDPSNVAAALAPLVPAEGFGTFDLPVEATEAGPCHAGQAFEVHFKARPGERLSFATGFSASNDWFIAPPGEGMELFNGTLPRWGEITTEFQLYDLGTESDQELDVGGSVGTQQTAPNTGSADNTKTVREVGRDRYDVPLTHHIRVTLTPPQKN